jgi:hypothetical protein
MMRANYLKGMRRPVQSRALMSYPMSFAYKISKTMMPKISDTERAALNAGTGAYSHPLNDTYRMAGCFVPADNALHLQSCRYTLPVTPILFDLHSRRIGEV